MPPARWLLLLSLVACRPDEAPPRPAPVASPATPSTPATPTAPPPAVPDAAAAVLGPISNAAIPLERTGIEVCDAWATQLELAQACPTQTAEQQQLAAEYYAKSIDVVRRRSHEGLAARCRDETKRAKLVVEHCHDEDEN